MFTIEAIKAAHSKVKSGADFPAYIQEIKALGVSHYETFVADGRMNYYGTNDHAARVPAKYDNLEMASQVNTDEFISELKAHQQGKTDFLTFITMCARCGIEKWEIDMGAMTCTYFDVNGNKALVEMIPG